MNSRGLIPWRTSEFFYNTHHLWDPPGLLMNTEETYPEDKAAGERN
jgi:hypothetical protein